MTRRCAGAVFGDIRIAHAPNENNVIGLSLVDAADVVVRGNDLHHLGHDNIIIVGACEDVLVQDNYIHHSVTPKGSGRHADGIQMYGQGTAGSTDARCPRRIRLIGNHIWSGTEFYSSQGQLQAILFGDPIRGRRHRRASGGLPAAPGTRAVGGHRRDEVDQGGAVSPEGDRKDFPAKATTPFCQSWRAATDGGLACYQK